MAFYDLSFLPTACALIFDIRKGWKKFDAVCQLTPYSIPSGSGQKITKKGMLSRDRCVVLPHHLSIHDI